MSTNAELSFPWNLLLDHYHGKVSLSLSFISPSLNNRIMKKNKHLINNYRLGDEHRLMHLCSSTSGKTHERNELIIKKKEMEEEIVGNRREIWSAVKEFQEKRFNR